MRLQEYLAFCVEARERLQDFSAVHIVLGNEACDLDSAVSAITYAYYLHETSAAPVGTVLFLPLLQIPRSDFPLRTEIVHFFGKFSITADELIFMDDLDLASVKAKTDLKVTLVDHHVLSTATADLEENVVQILDHRPKDGDLPDRCESTLELVGSCATLVSEALLTDETFDLDPVSATLLYGTILTDTINFSPAAGKTTPKDLDLAKQLKAVIGEETDGDSLFEEIKTAKFSLSGLTSKQILAKDVKLVSGDSLMVAMSSVTMHLTELMEREDFGDSLKSFAAEKKVDAVVVMALAMGADDSVSRQLGVFSPSRVYRQQMADVLIASHSPSLGLSPLSCGLEEFLPFLQSNVTASRKQVLPIIKAFLAGETTPDETQADAYSDLPKDRSEGFTSMSSIVGSRQNTFDGEITSEDLTSRDNSTEAELSPDENLLQSDQKMFDPLSSIHSSDSETSPTDVSKNADVANAEEQLPVSGEVEFDALSKPETIAAEDSQEFQKGEAEVPNPSVKIDNNGDEVKPSESSGSGYGLSPNPSLANHDSALPNADQLLYNEASQDPDSMFSSPAGLNQNNSDPSHHNGLDDEALEQDFLNMVSPHELLFPTDSPLDVSAATSGHTSGQTSGQTSGHTSKVPSYPVTPPNSYMEGGLMEKEVQLPSFNSSEMVEKIHEKKAALGASGSEESETLSPFTPQNSYAESSFPSKETQLPSFHSSDMVERIREKRSSMERDVQGAGEDLDTLLDAVKSPFTPPNSFVEGSFEKYAHENLPSLNNAEIANKIKQKQAELTAAAGQDSGSASPVGLTGSTSPGAPYTPQNSYRESVLESLSVDSHLTDLNEVAERLSLTGSESSGSLNEPKSIKASNRVHLQSPQESAGFSVSEMEESTSLSSPQDVEQERSDSNKDPRSASMEVKKKGVSFSQQPDEDPDSAVAEETIQKIAYELANEMIQKALETFPSESVKELVPAEVSSERSRTYPSISEDSSPTVDESDREFSPDISPTAEQRAAKSELSPDREAPDSALVSSTESERLAAHLAQVSESAMKTSSSLADELAQALNKSVEESETSSQKLSVSETDIPKSESYEIETEYLSDMNPMQKVGVFHPDANVIETDADKEVVEGASFRKISGQEYQTVQEDILEQIRQEAREREIAKRRQSSVAEEEDDTKGAVTSADDSAGKDNYHSLEEKKKIAPADVEEFDLDDSLTDQEGKKRIHVVRDRELYASALENESAVEEPEERTLQPSNTSHPLMDSSMDDSGIEESSKRKILPGDASLSVEQHRYESFAESGSLENAEGRAGESKQGGNSSARRGVARTTSATSDVSTSGLSRGSSLKGVELCDEWQDDELPKIIGEEAQALAGDPAVSENRKRLMPDEELVKTGDDLENVEVVDSDSEIDSDMDNEQLEWENDTPVQTPSRPPVVEEEIPQYSAAEERRDAQNWKVIRIGDDEDFRLDMKVIEPYKRVLSHGGYCGEGLTAMIVFSACYLPSRDRKDYSYVMNHLFHYVIHTLDELVADDYMIVYFHGATPKRQMPNFSWLKRCYQGIDRRLKKNLKALYLVHPTLWIKTLVLMTRPFISAKFSSKLRFVRTLADLKRQIPMEYVYIPEIVQSYDDRHFQPTSPSTPSSPSVSEQ